MHFRRCVKAMCQGSELGRKFYLQLLYGAALWPAAEDRWYWELNKTLQPAHHLQQSNFRVRLSSAGRTRCRNYYVQEADNQLSCGFLTYQFFGILLDKVITEPDETRCRLFWRAFSVATTNRLTLDLIYFQQLFNSRQWSYSYPLHCIFTYFMPSFSMSLRS